MSYDVFLHCTVHGIKVLLSIKHVTLHQDIGAGSIMAKEEYLCRLASLSFSLKEYELGAAAYSEPMAALYFLAERFLSLFC